jgi:Flp pilus assembly protein TadG
MLRSIRAFHKDERGAALIWFSIIVVALVGVIGLAVDGARYQNLHSNMQEIADAAALAGAKELDGASDAITRATYKAVNYLTNNPSWSDVVASGVQIVDSGANGPQFFGPDINTVATDPKNAAFIKVTTIDRAVTPSFIRAVSNSSTVYASATATAKSSFSVCKPLQSFMCNPYEGSETNPGNANNWITTVPVGHMLKLVGGSGSAAGNWGLIQPPNANGNPHNLAPFWAETSPDSCAAASPAEASAAVDTGNNGPFAVPGMNVRFDNPTAAGNESLSAPVVIDGLKSNGGNNYLCANSVSATPVNGANTFQQTDADATAYGNYCNAKVGGLPIGSCPLPRDRAFTNYGGTGGWQPALVGNGANTADLDAYWANHHTGTRPAEFDTRYKIYQAEAAGTAAFTAGSDAIEPHAPACSRSTVGDADRRLIQVAIVDCNYWSINGNSNSLPATTLVAQFFMTEPATADGSMYAELIKTFQLNDPNGAVFQIIQLAR